MTDHVSILAPPLQPAATDPSTDLVQANGWWPAVSIARFRNIARVTPEVTEERVRTALRTGMATALIDLGAWEVMQRASGFASLEAVPAVQIDGVSHKVLCWQRAVVALAKCELVETHRDTDATGAGERKVNFLDDTIIQLRRDAQHAIRDLLARSRTFVELI